MLISRLALIGKFSQELSRDCDIDSNLSEWNRHRNSLGATRCGTIPWDPSRSSVAACGSIATPGCPWRCGPVRKNNRGSWRHCDPSPEYSGGACWRSSWNSLHFRRRRCRALRSASSSRGRSLTSTWWLVQWDSLAITRESFVNSWRYWTLSWPARSNCFESSKANDSRRALLDGNGHLAPRLRMRISE